MQMRDVEKNSYILPVSHIKKIKFWYLNPLDASFESGTYFKTTVIASWNLTFILLAILTLLESVSDCSYFLASCWNFFMFS